MRVRLPRLRPRPAAYPRRRRRRPRSPTSGTPGCKKGGQNEGSEPAAPVRARVAHDQAPVLEDRIAPGALCGLYAAHRNPPVRGPTLVAPSPVELSVLRV